MITGKFTVAEISSLRSEFLQSGLDSWQTAELFQMFLAGRGYGVSPAEAINAVSRIEGAGCTLEVMQTELEKIALVM